MLETNKNRFSKEIGSYSKRWRGGRRKQRWHKKDRKISEFENAITTTKEIQWMGSIPEWKDKGRNH